MNPQQLLEKLGYSPHQAKLYVAALELGDATITDLAHHTEIPRTTVAEAVEDMQKKGLLLPYFKKQHKYFVAQDPGKILAILRANEESFSNLMPELLALRKTPKTEPSILIHTGITEIKRIMDDIIASKHHISALMSTEDWFKFFGEDYTREFIRQRHSHFLKMRLISPRTETALRLKKNDDQELRHIKFLPASIDLKGITNFIYGDKIAIISFNKQEPMGLLISDPDVTYGNTIYFENLWLHCNEN